jgi:hypothetical protein
MVATGTLVSSRTITEEHLRHARDDVAGWRRRRVEHARSIGRDKYTYAFRDSDCDRKCDRKSFEDNFD